MKVFLAGATGAIGRQLVPQLRAAGHDVYATTRSPDKQAQLWNAGAHPLVMDALDPESVGTAVATAAPDVVIHQLTAITNPTNVRHFDRVFAATNRLRSEGVDNLLAAARASGVRRFIAQSFAGWPFAAVGGPVKTEEDPFEPNPPHWQRQSLAAIKHTERAVTEAPLEGVVLRYGLFYGHDVSPELFDAIRKRQLPIAGDGGGIWSFTHVDDAASATVAALVRGRGIYNVVDDEPAAVRDLFPAIAEILGAKPPRHVPVWLARLVAGEVGVRALTQLRGAANAKARHELEWAPSYPSWRDGLRHEVVRAR